ncbi:MAG: hypothetical protein K6G88_05150 [Lachnospiraceae bacterium]|nr:hypothetical protein [Lachnospiraceae bacterium]
MANSRLRALSGLNNDGQENKESRYSQLQKEVANRIDERDLNPVMVRKQKIEQKALECKENDEDKRNAIEEVEGQIQQVRNKMSAIKDYISQAETVCNMMDELEKTFEMVIKSLTVKKNSSGKLFGEAISDSVLNAMGKNKTLDDLIAQRNGLVDYIEKLDDENPIKSITNVKEFKRVKNIEKDSKSTPWNQISGIIGIRMQNEAVATIDILKNVIMQCSDLKAQCYLMVNDELKKENDLYDKIGEIVGI